MVSRCRGCIKFQERIPTSCLSLHPVCVSAGVCNKLKWLLAWPLCLLLYFTVPNCSKPRWENWFLLSFASSTLWIASFSYIMVWMVRDQPGFSLLPVADGDLSSC